MFAFAFPQLPHNDPASQKPVKEVIYDITLEIYKAALGSKLHGLSDEQIKHRMMLQERFSREVHSVWRKMFKKNE